MKLFEVTNGGVGESYVKVYTIAIDESAAIEQATVEYKKEYKDNVRGWESLAAEVLCNDTSVAWVSEVRDD